MKDIFFELIAIQMIDGVGAYVQQAKIDPVSVPTGQYGCSATEPKNTVPVGFEGKVLQMNAECGCNGCLYTGRDIQPWCSSQLPYKCNPGPLWPAWEYRRTRVRKYFTCGGLTYVCCEGWSSIQGAECCNSQTPVPSCGDAGGNPPVTVPECASE